MRQTTIVTIMTIMQGLTWSVAATAAPHGKCASLSGATIAAAAIGLPTRGATITEAQDLPAGNGLPAACVVTGEIKSKNPGDPPIRFEVNLPSKWNGKALQLGGGGFDGKLVTGLGNLPGTGHGRLAPVRPLARGYVTFGSDGGHEGNMATGAAFGKNDTALANYLGAAVKRVRDTAAAVIERYYGKPALRYYFAGGSKGGQEGLVAAERYGKDYDGVIAYYPAKDMAALVVRWARMLHATYGAGGAVLSPAKQRMVRARVMAACDDLDGIRDGIIANTAACRATISPVNLACAANVANSDHCLTPAEVRTLLSATEDNTSPFLFAYGLSRIGRFPIMTGGKFWWWMSPKGQNFTAYGGFVTGVIENFFGGAATKVDPANVNPVNYVSLLSKLSNQGDATSTDLDVFVKHGGKMILAQGGADMLVAPTLTTAWYVRLKARYPATANDFVRYYVQPGFGHSRGDFMMSYDSLTALDNWVEKGRAPKHQISRDANSGRAMPLCNYPAFPRYVGGSSRSAESYRCSLD